MRPFWKYLPVALLGASLSLAPAANGQSPRGQRPGSDQPPAGGNRPATEQPRERGGDRRDDRKSSSEVEAWVKTLAEKITDPHDTIRDSARAAMVAVGPPALPMLRKLMEGENDAKATAAKKLIAAIEHGGNRPGEGARPQGPFPPMAGRGFGGFGNFGSDRRPDAGPRDGDRRPEGGDRRPEGERKPGEDKPREGGERPSERPRPDRN